MGLMVYIDDDYNIAVMGSVAFDATTDVSVSIGNKAEISFDADNVNSMAGGSMTYGANASTPIINFGVNGAYSRSLDSKTSSYSWGGSLSYGKIPVSVGAELSYNKSFIQFNPVEWLKNFLNIK